MSNLLANYSFFEYILLTLLSILCGLSIRYSLSIAKQLWALTYHHTLTFCLLPVITMIVTTLIAGNLALSLGMIGALSIVRFRNPVRSPLELTVYFACITSGIAASVHLRWLLYFLVAVLIVVLVLFIVSQIYKIFNKKFFIVSFSEGNPLSILEITAKSDISILDKSKFLSSKIKTQEEITYELSNSNFKDLQDLLDQIKKENNLINYQLRSNQ